jgi:large subunit ribosomal protein L21
MYAIIETGGKQYRVAAGDVVSLEKLTGDVGHTVTFDKILLVGGGADNKTLVGKPYVAQASLQGEIVQQTRGEKILTIKYKRRKGYRRTIGHRQELTRLLITKVDNGSGNAVTFEASKRAEALRAASVPFATRKEHSAKKASAKSGEETAAAKKSRAPAKKTAAKKK